MEDRSVDIKVYAEDWQFKSDGTKEFKPAGSVRGACSNWIYISPDKFTLRGKEEKAVQFTLTVPANAEGGHWSVLFFEAEIAREKKLAGTGVVLAGRIGTLIYQETKGRVTKQGYFSSVATQAADENKPFIIKYIFNNEGNTPLVINGNAIILNSAGEVQGKLDLPRTTTLPRGKGIGEAQWLGKLAEGRYSVVLSADYGGLGPASAENKFFVQRKLEIKNIKAVNDKRKITRVTFEILNSGNLNAQISGNLELLDKHGQRLSLLPLPARLLGAGSSQKFTQTFNKNLAPGSFSVAVNIKADNRSYSRDTVFTVR